MFEAGDFAYHEVGARDSDADERLHLKPLAIDGDRVEGRPPEGAVAVVEVCVSRAEQDVHQSGEAAVAQMADLRVVVAARTLEYARALGEVRTVEERFDEGRDSRGSIDPSPSRAR